MQFLHTVGRGLIYASCMLGMYALVYRPALSTSASATSAYEKQQAEQTRAYQEQVARSNAMFVESENQQKRMAEILTKQEELVKRLDSVMSAWERQAGVTKKPPTQKP